MNIVFLGVSGAGKGTQAKRLSKHFDIEHVSTGDILREHMANKTQIGIEIQNVMDTGRLVSDELVIKIVKDKLSSGESKKGYILDGFPRNLFQAEELCKFADITAAIYVSVPDEEVIERLTGRIICPKCGLMYHVTNLPPKKEGICDECGTKLIQREDDKAETVKGRLKIFHELTEPIISYYKNKNLLFEVTGKGDINSITDILINYLEEKESK